MFLEGLSRSIHNLYDSIPGKTSLHKLDFMAKTVSAVITGFFSARGGFPAQILPSIIKINQSINPSSPFNRYLILMGIGQKISNMIFNAELFRHSSSLKDRFSTFCIFYLEAYQVTFLFKSLFPKQNSQAEVHRAADQTIYSQTIDCLFQLPSLAVRNFYHPIQTSIGLSLGVITKIEFLKFASKIFKISDAKITDNINALFILTKRVLNISLETNISTITKILAECYRMTLSVESPLASCYYSFTQGYELGTLFEKWERPQPSKESKREQ